MSVYSPTPQEFAECLLDVLDQEVRGARRELAGTRDAADVVNATILACLSSGLSSEETADRVLSTLQGLVNERWKTLEGHKARHAEHLQNVIAQRRVSSEIHDASKAVELDQADDDSTPSVMSTVAVIDQFRADSARSHPVVLLDDLTLAS